MTPHAPHLPSTPAPRHRGTLKGCCSKQPSDPAYDELVPIGRWKNSPPVNSTLMNEVYEMRAESLLAVDEMIGGLVDELTRQGIMENTWATPKASAAFPASGSQVQKVSARRYFFYTCDNGYHLGQHRLQPGKREGFMCVTPSMRLFLSS